MTCLRPCSICLQDKFGSQIIFFTCFRLDRIIGNGDISALKGSNRKLHTAFPYRLAVFLYFPKKIILFCIGKERTATDIDVSLCLRSICKLHNIILLYTLDLQHGSMRYTLCAHDSVCTEIAGIWCISPVTAKACISLLYHRNTAVCLAVKILPEYNTIIVCAAFFQKLSGGQHTVINPYIVQQTLPVTAGIGCLTSHCKIISVAVKASILIHICECCLCNRRTHIIHVHLCRLCHRIVGGSHMMPASGPGGIIGIKQLIPFSSDIAVELETDLTILCTKYILCISLSDHNPHSGSIRRKSPGFQRKGSIDIQPGWRVFRNCRTAQCFILRLSGRTILTKRSSFFNQGCLCFLLVL